METRKVSLAELETEARLVEEQKIAEAEDSARANEEKQRQAVARWAVQKLFIPERLCL